jgi:hypothetical protein
MKLLDSGEPQICAYCWVTINTEFPGLQPGENQINAKS